MSAYYLDAIHLYVDISQPISFRNPLSFLSIILILKVGYHIGQFGDARNSGHAGIVNDLLEVTDKKTSPGRHGSLHLKAFGKIKEIYAAYSLVDLTSSTYSSIFSCWFVVGLIMSYPFLNFQCQVMVLPMSAVTMPATMPLENPWLDCMRRRKCLWSIKK